MKNQEKIRPSLGADERGLLTTFGWAVVTVALFAFILKSSVSQSSWIHDFFFKRSFVQWVLLTAFAIGFIHLLRRVPAWYRERRALKTIQEDKESTTSETFVGRRWIQIAAARNERHRNLGEYTRSLAEHDEAEVDAAYRVSGDAVQVLPLIGFFGTVFGLSHGLYTSFLATGGTNTKDFAKAIAIAFDNTLLGLALTIILFLFQSILRKREEALMLQLNLLASDTNATAVQEQGNDTLPDVLVALRTTMKDHEQAIREHLGELEKSRKVLESPAGGIAELVQTHTTAVATAVVKEVVTMQRAEHDKVAQAVLSQLQDQANKLLDLVGQRTLAFIQLGDPMRAEVTDIKTNLSNLFSVASTISEAIGTLAKNTTRPQLEELSAAVNSLVSVLSQRDTVMLERLQALEETKSKLDSVAAEARNTAHVVAGFGARLDAVPDERRKVEDLAVSIKELAVVLVQRDSVMLNSLQGSLDAHSREIKSEIRLPRTIKFVEASHLSERDGGSQKQ